MIIPRNIEQDEGFAHYLFLNHFKKASKKLQTNSREDVLNIENIDYTNIMLPNKGGVSLQRIKYCCENTCKQFALKIPKTYVGFLVFNKTGFDEALKGFKESRPNFEAELVATPLDENNEEYDAGIEITTDTEGNPFHCDLNFINPANEGKETPKTALRSFNRKLVRCCKVLLDTGEDEKKYSGIVFSEVVF